MNQNPNKSSKVPMERFGSSEGGSTESGLSSRERVPDNPESLGMGNRGFSKNQTPLGPKKGKAKGPFDFC